MEILFLTVSDQHNHSLHKYVDLHCNFDFIAWENGFRNICSSLHIFDYYSSFVSTGPIAMEISIRNLVLKHKIQLLIVPNLYYELAPTFLAELRALGCRSMIIFFDDSMRFEDTNRFYLSSFDYYLTHESNDSKELYKTFGIEPEFFPNFPSRSFYKEIIHHLDKKTFKYATDVVFVGARIADRNIFVDYLKHNGIDIAAFGRGWTAGMLATDEMIGTFNLSKISLSFIKTIDGSGRTQFKGRLFEIIMAGGFVLSEYCDELTEYFDVGHEIDTFKSPQELLAKVKYYLENNDLREAMSARARIRAETNYSFESNWRRYLTAINDGRVPSEYPNSGYEVSAAAILAFLGWNFSIIYGRFMLGQYRLACQQYEFCRRELKTSAHNSSVTREFIIWLMQRFLIMIFNNIFSRNNIQRIRQGFSRCRELVVSMPIRKKIMFKLEGVSAFCVENSEIILQEAAHKVSGFIQKQKVPGKEFEFLYSESATRPTLYSSVYACMTLSLLGKLNVLTVEQKSRWIEYFDTFQSADDGLFYDPTVQSEIYADTDWWGARHLALHLISAYTALGGKPKYPFRFLEQYYEPNIIAVWLDEFDWQSSISFEVDIDNKIMNIGCLLQYQRDTWDDSDASDAVRYLQRYLNERINPKTGMWGKWNATDSHQRSRIVQFAYHLFPLFFFDKQELEHPDLIVDHVLKTQNAYGGFGVRPNSSACEDIDSIDILCRLAPYVPERKNEIDTALQRALKWVLCNQVEDGGFVFRLHEAFTYGHSEMMSKANEGSMFATWFRILSLAYLKRYFPPSFFWINNSPGLEN